MFAIAPLAPDFVAHTPRVGNPLEIDVDSNDLVTAEAPSRPYAASPRLASNAGEPTRSAK